MSGPARAPQALCSDPKCGEPLVRTLEYADPAKPQIERIEFVCWKCGRLHRVLDPVPGFATDEQRAIQQRYQDEYEADFRRRSARAE